ncbi:AsmA family protein [Aestuariivirga sp.]|uniref:AsmA family protein n=1 Tax=Aestuariivirga sp. TaxID=2650926 RepID=UPI0039E61206
MTVWKSPILYLGILLLVAVLGLLAAPYVVDWNSYRTDLEAYGHKLTGRKVRIAGPISVQLFPWPSLTAQDVHLADADGRTDFASAGQMKVRMQLAGLFSGTIQVESVEIEKPVITIERSAEGQGNWQFSPAADLAANELLGRVKLDQISLTDAVVHIIDHRRANGDVKLVIPRADASAPGFQGPWRIRASEVDSGGRSFSAAFSTGIWRSGEPFRVGLTVTGLEGAVPAYSFDGQMQDGGIVGDVTIATGSTEGKTDAEGTLRALTIKSKLTATFNAVALDSIEIAPLDPSAGGTLITGDAKLALGSHIGAEINLSAPKLDFAEWAGAKANTLLRQGGTLAVADGFLKLLPKDMDVAGSLKVTALTAGSDTLENVTFRAEANSEAIRVKEISSSLPGRSRVLFNGVFFPGASGAELAGSLALEANDFRQLVTWGWPEQAGALKALWTGQRGHFKMQTDVSLTSSRLRLSSTQYELDGILGSGEVEAAQGGRGSIDVTLKTDRLDIDSYVKGGLAALLGGGKDGLGGVLTLLLPHPDSRDLRFNITAGEMALNGVTAKTVSLDAASGANGLDLRKLEIGDVSGAKFSASGLILDAGSGPDGTIGIDTSADDPRGLLRLVGLLPQDHDPAWASALGVSAFKGILGVKMRDGSPATSLTVDATSGPLVLKGKLTGTGRGILTDMNFDGSGDLTSKTSADMARLLGLTAASTDGLPGHFSFNGSGNWASGFHSLLSLEAYGNRVDFVGTLGGVQPWSGKLAIRSTDVSPAFAAMGLPLATIPTGVLVLDTPVTVQEGGISLDALTGRFGYAPLSGKLAIDGKAHVSGTVATGPISLAEALGALFLDWTGAAPDAEAPLAARLPFGLTGEVWVKPQQLILGNGLVANEAQIGITASADELRLAMFGKDVDGHDASFELGSKVQGDSRVIDGKMTFPVNLDDDLKLAGGNSIAQGSGTLTLTFNGQGRTPAGVLAGLKGTGAYDLKGVTLLGVSPQGFGAALDKAGDAAGVNAAFEALRTGTLALGDRSGSIAVDNGVATLQPITFADTSARTDIKTTAELSNGLIDIGINLELLARDGLPPMEISYAGPPSALARAEDKSELAAKLGYAIMQKGVAELERLQQEQARLAAEEEKQRAEDEAKLADYYAQRDELLVRRRELKVQSDMRVMAAEALRQQLLAEQNENADMSKAELKQRVRELRVQRRIARMASGDAAPVQEAKPKPAAKPKPKPQIQVPVILVPQQQESPTQQ